MPGWFLGPAARWERARPGEPRTTRPPFCGSGEATDTPSARRSLLSGLRDVLQPQSGLVTGARGSLHSSTALPRAGAAQAAGNGLNTRCTPSGSWHRVQRVLPRALARATAKGRSGAEPPRRRPRSPWRTGPISAPAPSAAACMGQRLEVGACCFLLYCSTA